MGKGKSGQCERRHRSGRESDVASRLTNQEILFARPDRSNERPRGRRLSVGTSLDFRIFWDASSILGSKFLPEHCFRHFRPNQEIR